MFLADNLTLDAPRRTSDGYLAVRARAARAGVYSYTGQEVDPRNEHGLRDEASVNVLRDEATVFDKKAVHSFIGKPITNDHPTAAVNSANWRDHARGVVMGAQWQEGGYLAFDLLLTDQAAIDAVQNGKRQLSNGYEAILEFGDFTSTDGVKCPARQAAVKGNHVAIVDRGRAGEACAISDVAHCDALPTEIMDRWLADERTYTDKSGDGKTGSSNSGKAHDGEVKMPHTLMIDGLQVPNVSDEAKAAIEKLQGQVRVADEAKGKAETDLAKLTTDKAELDAKVVTLEKQVVDAKLTPQQLRDAAKAYQTTVDKAKALGVEVTDEMDEAAIQKAVVSARLGDAAKDWSAEQVAVSFATLTAQVDDVKPDHLRTVIASQPTKVGDNGASVRDLARSMQYN